MLYLKEGPRLPKGCVHKCNGAGIGEGIHYNKHRQVDMWSRGIAETEKGPVWAGSSGTYRLERSDWKKICDGALWGSVITNCNGKVVSIGGACSRQYSKSVKVLDEDCRRWTDLPSMIVPCHDPCVGSTCSGDIIVMGGMGAGGIGLDVVQVFNASTQAWQRGPSLPRECWGASCAVHGDTIFMAGGAGMASSVWSAPIHWLLDYSEHTCSASLTWKELPDLPYHYSTLCVVDNILIAIGGKDNEGQSSMKTSSLYAFNGQRWMHIGEMPLKAYWVDATVLHQGEMLVVDGCSLSVMKGDHDVKAIAEFKAQQLALETGVKQKEDEIDKLQHNILHHQNELKEVKKELEELMKEKKIVETKMQEKDKELQEWKQKYERLQAQVQPLSQLRDRCKKYEEDAKVVRVQNRRRIEQHEIRETEAWQEVIDLLSAMARDRKHSNELLDKEIKHLRRESADLRQHDESSCKNTSEIFKRLDHRLKVLESHQEFLSFIQHCDDTPHCQNRTLPPRDFPQLYPDGIHSRPRLYDLMNKVAAKIPHKWQDIAVQLNLSFEWIQYVEQNNPKNPNSCYMQVFKAWENKEGDTSPYTWESLLQILASPAVDCRLLEQSLRENIHPGATTMTPAGSHYYPHSLTQNIGQQSQVDKIGTSAINHNSRSLNHILTSEV